MLTQLDGLLWLLVTLGPLFLFQSRLHREIQAVLLLLTRRKEVAIVLFSLVFFPGVLVHEGSHYLAAKLLGVRTGRFSLLPRPTRDGRLQMGSVETDRSDVFRSALIGAAPLLVGGALVAYIGFTLLRLHELWPLVVAGNLSGLLNAVTALPRVPDFWLWFYLAFAISSTMLPSASDRQAWLPVALVVVGLVVLGLLAGLGVWLLNSLGPLVNDGLRAAAAVFGLAALFHLILLPLAVLARQALSSLTGMKVV